MLHMLGRLVLTWPLPTQTATPVQAARADHLCFPHLPDVLAMCTALSDKVDDESFRSKRPKLDPKSAEEAGEAFSC